MTKNQKINEIRAICDSAMRQIDATEKLMTKKEKVKLSKIFVSISGAIELLKLSLKKQRVKK
jgi:hypothetical protein